MAARKKSRWPTNKWIATQLTAAGVFLTAWITAGQFTKAIQIALVGLVVQAVAGYLVPNDEAPGGVHARASAEDRGAEPVAGTTHVQAA